MRGTTTTDTDVARECADDDIHDQVRELLEREHEEAVDGPPVLGIALWMLLAWVIVGASCWLICH